MEYQFSDKIQNGKASAIREILKLMSDPDIISFGGGNPASEAFPTQALRQISDELFETQADALLQYGISEGVPEFLEAITAYVNRNETVTRADDTSIITTGSQQVMDLLSRTLINDGDVVLAENPSFLGALTSFKINGATVKGIEMEADGMNLEALEHALKTTPNVKFIYVIPNFQNPTGITTTLEKRQGILDLARAYNVVILEDNPYGDLRYTGEAIPSIKSLDTEGIVVYAASMSKIFAPGLRIAIMIANKELMSRVLVAKQSSDVNTNCWAQHVVNRYMRTHDMDEHLKDISQVYARKAHLMMDTMNETFAPGITWTQPEGGMFIWVTMPDTCDVKEFVKRALDAKVAVVPGNAFMDDDTKPCNSFRMNFSSPTDENIVKGVRILGDITKDMLEK